MSSDDVFSIVIISYSPNRNGKGQRDTGHKNYKHWKNIKLFSIMGDGSWLHLLMNLSTGSRAKLLKENKRPKLNTKLKDFISSILA
ncbi:hypothetical protein Naga_100574g4 [Nannochloropsis gaditana]|uniref:Uncharacterized protein n=1 Tax=Nannochloropsis gaditana TaxID=72520 RepID=W7T069_9STRA|nr:hypothetical protein Naga_100574g4 [Nannochloropsis gaditana]